MKIIKDYKNIYTTHWGEELPITKEKTNYICIKTSVEDQDEDTIFIKDINTEEKTKLKSSLYEEYLNRYKYISMKDIEIYEIPINPEMGEKIFTLLSEEYEKIKEEEEKEKIFFDKYINLKNIIKELKIPDFIPYEDENNTCEEDFANLNKICLKVAEENNLTYSNGYFYFKNIKFAMIDPCGYTYNSHVGLAWDYD